MGLTTLVPIIGAIIMSLILAKQVSPSIEQKLILIL